MTVELDNETRYQIAQFSLYVNDPEEPFIDFRDDPTPDNYRRITYRMVELHKMGVIPTEALVASNLKFALHAIKSMGEDPKAVVNALVGE